jgi:hypothetical protein
VAHSIYNQLKHKPTIYHSDILEASLIKSRESIIKGRWIRLPILFVKNKLSNGFSDLLWQRRLLLNFMS